MKAEEKRDLRGTFCNVLVRYMRRGYRDPEYSDDVLSMMEGAGYIDWERDPHTDRETIVIAPRGKLYLRYVGYRFPRLRHMIRYGFGGTVQ